MGALAAASRVLKDYNRQLAGEAIAMAKEAWAKERREPLLPRGREIPWFFNNAECGAALQMYITTKDEQFRRRFEELMWNQLDTALGWNMMTAVRAVPYMPAAYKSRLEKYVHKYKADNDKLLRQNPYGVPIGTRGWAGNYELINWSVTNYYLHKSFPNIIGRDHVYAGLNYVFGCHPYSNISFVAGVGTHSKKRTYGSNRADYSFIAGGVVPGVLMLKPDFLENKEDWPFLWGENECVIDICADYIFLVNAASELLNEETGK
jgi:hypothetical protein